MDTNVERLKVLGIQSVFFMRGLNMADPIGLAQGINSATGHIFNGSPAILPIQPGMPVHIPVIILKDKKEKFVCNVALARMDFRFTIQKDPPTAIRDVWGKYGSVLGQLIEFLTMKSPTPVWRLGFVVQFFVKLRGSANALINRNYLRDNIFGDTYEVHVNALHRIELGTIPANRWFRVKPTRSRSNPKDDTAMVVEVDINTFADRKQDFSREEIETFFENAYKHIITEDVKYIILE